MFTAFSSSDFVNVILFFTFCCHILFSCEIILVNYIQQQLPKRCCSHCRDSPWDSSPSAASNHLSLDSCAKFITPLLTRHYFCDQHHCFCDQTSHGSSLFCDQTSHSRHCLLSSIYFVIYHKGCLLRLIISARFTIDITLRDCVITAVMNGWSVS